MADETTAQPLAPPMAAPPVKAPTGPTGMAAIPPEQAGRRMQGALQVTMGLNTLERAAALLGGSQTEDGREVLQAVLKLRKRFGTAAPDVSRQEVKTLGEQVPPMQQPTPQQGAAMSKVMPRMAGAGIGGA